ncbi:50S ribosomal protein L19e [Candidatus Woesearchaeota archaeon]|nr:50S ribosomal protein L19e [Candidatus Woesearchaeota archaeon]
MNLKTKKRIAARVLKCSPNKVKLDSGSFEKIGDAITRADIKALISKSAITKEQDAGVSRFRAKARAAQKRKGRGKGPGSRKGRATARLPAKLAWMNKIRSQRELLNNLRTANKVSKETFRDLYLKAKGGFFRSKRHINLYIDEHELIKKD